MGGPNSIILGNPTESGFFQTATISNGSANIGVASAAAYPVGTPVQFDAAQNGFTVGVTYWVISSNTGTNVITLGPYAGASAITATGSSAVNVFAAPMPLTFSNATPPGLTFFGRGKFILTLSDPAISGVCNWTANGNQVSLNMVAPLTGSSGATTMTGAGVPQIVAPNVQQGFLAPLQNNTAGIYGYGTVSTTGALSFYSTPLGFCQRARWTDLVYV